MRAAGWGTSGSLIVPPEATPCVHYPGAGRELLGPPKWGDGTARRSYGRNVRSRWAFRGAYCGLDMSTFEGWLQLSVDHVVPQQMLKSGWAALWVQDQVNLVPCCMACNALFNRDPVPGAVPETLDAFLLVRDALFVRR